MRWNFVGSLIPLYRSTQAVGQFNANSSIYQPPIRNWAFDITFTRLVDCLPLRRCSSTLNPTGFKQIL
jgi:hypothetical protein